VQIDSVNVVVRSHYPPFFARLGAYDVALLHDLLYGKRRVFAEYWAHEASIVDFERWPLLRRRMDRARAGDGTWGNVARVGREVRALVKAVRKRIVKEGALAARLSTTLSGTERLAGPARELGEQAAALGRPVSPDLLTELEAIRRSSAPPHDR